MTSPLPSRWAAIEPHYAFAHYAGAGIPNGVRQTGRMTGALIFTAPHAVTQQREGRAKYADRYTGSLAEILATVTGGGAITVDGPLSGDPNWDVDDLQPFRAAVLAVARLDVTVIDVHGMKDSWGFDLNIGFGPAPNAHVHEMAESIATAASEAGLRVGLGVPFDARRPGTITHMVQSHGGTALQLEIAAKLRDPLQAPENASRLVAVIDRAAAVYGARAPERA